MAVELATGYVTLVPSARGFSAAVQRELGPALQQAGQRAGAETSKALDAGFTASAARFGAAAVSVGKRLTTSLTLPIVAAGAAAFKTSADFESSMAKIQGLVGIAGDEVASMRDRVLELSGQTAKSPQELADALFFLTSAGLRGDDALAALEASAKASAAGLGATQDITLAVAGALQSYKAEGLDAAAATDILVATVRAGNLEAADLAGNLGQILPVASAAGVGLEEVGGAVALITRTGLGASEAITGIRAAILALQSPTAEAAKALADAGVSTDRLRQVLAEQGLPAALKLVRDATGGNVEQFRRMLGSVEALNVANTILSASNEDLQATFGAVGEYAGLTDEAFQVAAETANFKLNQALANAKIALVDVGEAIAPVAGALIGFAGDAFDVFSTLPDPVQHTALGIAAVAAAAGPASIVVGRLAQGISLAVRTVGSGIGAVQSFVAGVRGVESAAGSTAGKLGTLVGRLGPAGLAGVAGVAAAALGIGAVVLDRWNQRKEEARRRTEAFTQALRDDSGALGENTRATVLNELQRRHQLDDLGRLRGHLESGRAAIDVFTAAIAGNTDAQREFRRALIASGEIEFKSPYTSQLRELTDAFVENGEIASYAMRGNVGLARSLQDLTDAHSDARAAVEATSDAERTAADVSRELAAAQRELSDLVAAGVTSGREYEAATARVTALQREQDRISRAVADATGQVAAEADDAAMSLDRLSGIITELFGTTLNAEQASLRWRDAIASLADTIAENGNTLDISTEKGRANRQAMVDATEAALSYASAIVQQTGNVEAANLVLVDHINQMIGAARQAGLSEQAALQYAASLLGIPPDVATTIANTGDLAKLVVDRYRTEGLAKIPGNVHTTVTADTAQAEANLARVFRVLRDLTRTTGRSFGELFGSGSIIEARAHGGPVVAGHAYVVGERRPELFVPDVDGFIHPSVPTGGDTITVYGRSDDELIRQLERIQRRKALLVSGRLR